MRLATILRNSDALLLALLLLPLPLLLILCGPVWGQSEQAVVAQAKATIWQVEVLLFAHRPGDIAWSEQQQLQDFRRFPVMPSVPVTPGTSGKLDAASEQMLNAWQKLQNRYDLLGYHRWHQLPGIGRRWRVHGDQVLSSAEQMASNMPNGDQSATDAADQNPAEYADTANAQAPEPHYILDGAIKINTGNIGVADLNVRERTRVLYYRNDDAASAQTDRAKTASAPAYRVRALQQSRRIQAGRMEYFDSSGLAALVLISRLPAFADDASAKSPEPL